MKKILVAAALLIAITSPSFAARQAVTSGSGSTHQWSIQKDRINANFVEVYAQAATKWVTGTAYTANNQMVVYGGNLYICQTNHTAGTFATDLAAVRWKLWGADVYAPVLGPDDNYVTDAEKTKLANLSGTNTGDQSLAGLVATTGNETIAGVKTFSSPPIVPTPTTDMQAATKKYVDDNGGSGTPEVVDETFNATNFDGGTTSAVSQDDFYDRMHLFDADDDGVFTDEAWFPSTTGAPTSASYLTATAEAGLSAEANLGALTTGLLKITVAAGAATPSTAVAGTDYQAPLTAGTNYLRPTTDVDDTPINNETAQPVSSNWAYDHVDAADPHTGYVLESALGTSVGAWLADPTAAKFFTAVTGEGAFAATLFGYADAAAVLSGIGAQAADADLTDLADGSLTGSKVGTGINGDNVTSGTIADARIASTIARDSELPNLATPGPIGGTTPAAVTATTLSAGAGGFAVDADGDTTVKSLNQAKTSGVAGDIGLYEANSTDTHAAGWRGPLSLTAAYRGQFANAGPTEAAIQVWGAQGSGDGAAATPYIHAVPFVNLGELFTVSGASLVVRTGTSLPGTCVAGALFLDTDADTNGQLYSCVATNTWKDIDDDGGAAGTPTAITVADTTDTTSYVALFESATGDLGPKTDAGLTYNAGTGMLTATGFTGPLTGTASGNLVSGGAAGTPSSITLTNGTGLPLSGVTDSTTEALGVGTIELGHASDTTIARSGAGAVTVEGVQVVLSGGAIGAATATTPSAQDNDTSVATTAFVNAEIAADAVLKATAKSLDFDWKSPVDADDRMIRLPTAITVTGLYCIATGTTPSIAVALNECDNAGANCAASGATVTADGGVDSDTTITDGAYDSADYLQITVGAPTGTVGYLTCSVTYTN